MKKIISLFILLFFSFSLFPVFASSSTSENYEDIDFPQWTKDLRRTEVIAFGSLPFVTIFTTLIYGGVLYTSGQVSSYPNPLDKSSDVLSSDQQLNILKYSVAISAGLGLFDLGWNLISRSSKKNKTDTSPVKIQPLSPEEAGELLKKNSCLKSDDDTALFSDNPETISISDGSF